MADKRYKVAIIGARGYVGNELLKLLAHNHYVDVVAVSSRSAENELVSTHIPAYVDQPLRFSLIQPETLGTIEADVFFLALPNQIAHKYVQAILSKKGCEKPIIIDISADHRFDADWVYGLPELNKQDISNSRTIANPGCYATAAMLALSPIKDWLVHPPSIFGVSGYSGAGKTPSDKNNAQRLKDNLMPYSLAGHMHENEISHHLGARINFMPHVAPHFRGLSVTVDATINKAVSIAELKEVYSDFYSKSVLIEVKDDIPELSQITTQSGALIGGFAIDQRRQPNAVNVRLVCVLDNLLKGAASQAIQNMNIALGLPECAGIFTVSK